MSQYYSPEGSAAYYPASVAKELANRGHEVKVVTGFPNYPSGKLAPGYRMKWRQIENLNGVEVLRVPLYLDHSNSAIRRIFNYISFGVSSALTRKWAGKPDAVYVYATQMTPALGPWIWRIFGGAPYILHVQDLWPDSILGSSMVTTGKLSKLIELIINPWLASVYSGASAVVAIAPTMAKTLINRGVAESKVQTVFNWGEVNREELKSRSSEQSSQNTEFLYAGNIGDMQDLESLVRAASELVDNNSIVRIVGDGVAKDRIQELSTQLASQNVVFEGSVPMDEIGDYYKKSKFAVVTLKDLPNFYGTIPSKFQAAISRGLPVISTVQGDLRRIIEDSKIGFTANSEDSSDLARALEKANSLSDSEYKQMVERTLELYEKYFSKESGISAIEKILEDVART